MSLFYNDNKTDDCRPFRVPISHCVEYGRIIHTGEKKYGMRKCMNLYSFISQMSSAHV